MNNLPNINQESLKPTTQPQWFLQVGFMIVGIALLVLMACMVSKLAQSSFVRVQFESLLWVRAKTVLPQVMGNKIMAPAEESCNLLGLDCVVQGNSLSVKDQTLPLSMQNGAALANFAKLVGLAGQKLRWNKLTGQATVSGGTGTAGWRQALGNVEGVDGNVNSTSGTPYSGPLESSVGPEQEGVPTVLLNLSVPKPITGMTVFSHSMNQMFISGSLVHGSTDNPSFKGCEDQKRCTLPVPRDALWVLAYLTTQP